MYPALRHGNFAMFMRGAKKKTTRKQGRLSASRPLCHAVVCIFSGFVQTDVHNTRGSLLVRNVQCAAALHPMRIFDTDEINDDKDMTPQGPCGATAARPKKGRLSA